jgi:hypothetical protein
MTEVKEELFPDDEYPKVSAEHLELRKAWIRFAEHALTGFNAWADGDGGLNKEEAVEAATTQADLMLAAYRLRFEK